MGTRARRMLSLSLLAISGCGAGGPSVVDYGDAQVVYLNFADGTEGITLGAEDDAARNVSRLCAIDAFARWRGAEGCGDRAACREDIRARVAGYYADYAIRFTTDRPPSGVAYTMVVVAPPSEECSFGKRGVAFADCGNANRANIAFVSDCEGDVESCAVLIAHETAHTFGLVHVVDERDVMVAAPEDGALRFGMGASAALENECGVGMQSSGEVLGRVLGESLKR